MDFGLEFFLAVRQQVHLYIRVTATRYVFNWEISRFQNLKSNSAKMKIDLLVSRKHFFSFSVCPKINNTIHVSLWGKTPNLLLELNRSALWGNVWNRLLANKKRTGARIKPATVELASIPVSECHPLN